jgi:hypothetical protein
MHPLRKKPARPLRTAEARAPLERALARALAGRLEQRRVLAEQALALAAQRVPVPAVERRVLEQAAVPELAERAAQVAKTL